MSPTPCRSLRQVRSVSLLALLAGFPAGPVSAASSVGALSPPSACAAEAGSVCLGDGRFLVEVGWFGELSGAATGARALGPDAAHFAAPGGAVLVVQVIDGRAVNGHFWVLSATLGDARYRLQVTDLATGQRRSYGELDGGAVGDLVALPAPSRAALPPASGATPSACSAEGPGVCLSSGLRVEARRHGEAERFTGEALSERTALFRRAGDRDPELVVSVLDGREVDGERWVLTTSPVGEAWDIGLAEPASEEPRTLRHALAASDVQLVEQPGRVASVTVTLDTARAVTKTIPVGGGSLLATAANGTKFRLEIPADALVSPQEITLTPIRAIGGLPFKGGLAGGVEIAPAGLRLTAVATLLITPTKPVALAQETTFAYRARGAQFFLYPARLTGKPVVLPVLHAGGYGLARGTAAEQAQQLARLPPRAEDQFSQKLWDVHARLRRSPAPAGAPVARATAAAAPIDLPTLYDQVYANQLRRLLPEIAGSCAGWKKWGPLGINFIANAIVDGVSDGLVAEIEAVNRALTRGLVACYDEAGRGCVDKRDGKAVIPMLLYWRLLLLEDKTSAVDAGKLQSCLTFELKFTSVVDHEAKTPGAWANGTSHHSLGSNAFIRWSPPFANGSSPSATTSYAATFTDFGQPEGCSLTATGNVQESVLKVLEMLFLGVNPFEEAPPLPKIELTYSPGNPKIELVNDCPGPPPTSDHHWLPLFAPAYLALHALELDAELGLPPLDNVYVAAQWDVKQASLYAVRKYLGQPPVVVPPLRFSEATILYLHHRPGS